MNRLRMVTLGVVLTLGVAACGRAAPPEGTRAAVAVDQLFAEGDGGGNGAIAGGEGAVAGAGEPSGTGADPLAGQPGMTGGGVGGGVEGPGGGGVAGSGGGGTGGGVRTAARQVPMGKGVTAGEIRIGLQVSKELGAGFALVGASGEAPDERKIAAAMVEWVNANGGLAGRKLVPVWHETDVTSGSFSTQSQAACATLTEDNTVFAAVSSAVGGNDTMAACMAQKRTPLVERNLWLFDTPYYREFAGYLYQPGKMRADRWGAAYADGLAASGFLKGAKLGLVRFDGPVFQRVADGAFKPALARHGVKITDEAVLSTPGGVSDFGGMAAEINNAILRFRTSGVTHVVFIENAGILPFFWMPQAESSGFHPRYGIPSNSIPATIAGQAPAAQLKNAVIVGWTPPNDVPAQFHPGGNPAWARCNAIMTKAGTSGAAGFYTQSTCDAFFFLKAVADTAPSLDAAGFRAAVERLGSGFNSPFTFATRFGPGRHDGAAQWRTGLFFDDCACFRYTGPLQAAP